MLVVHEITASDEFSYLWTDQDMSQFDDWDEIGSVADWVKPELQLADPDLPLGDWVGFLPDVPVLSPNGYRCLKELLEPCVQFLPLQVLDVGTCYAINVTTWLDALNFQESKVRRFSSSGRLMGVDEYVFRTEVIGDAPIFRQRGLRGEVFCTNRLQEAFAKHGLVGMRLKRIWSDARK